MRNLVSPRQLSSYLGVSMSTLEGWRRRGHVVIPFVRVGATVRYKPEDIDAYLEQRKVAQ